VEFDGWKERHWTLPFKVSQPSITSTRASQCLHGKLPAAIVFLLSIPAAPFPLPSPLLLSNVSPLKTVLPLHWQGERYSLVFFTPLGCDPKDFYWLAGVNGDSSGGDAGAKETEGTSADSDFAWKNRLYVCAIALGFLGNMLASRNRSV
jgi:hypothetical protein